MKFLIILLFGLFGVSAFSQNMLTIKVQEVESTKGDIIVALYNEMTFLKQPLNNKKVKATKGTVIIQFENLPQGKYAIALFQDENGDGKQNRNFIGIPSEPYGLSNNPKLFGKPTFDVAAFDLKDNKTISIKLK